MTGYGYLITGHGQGTVIALQTLQQATNKQQAKAHITRPIVVDIADRALEPFSFANYIDTDCFDI